jgi:hypothetical protein
MENIRRLSDPRRRYIAAQKRRRGARNSLFSGSL